ncbi:MAG: hypothetical protein QXT53_05960 [Ignisphaera sp.]
MRRVRSTASAGISGFFAPHIASDLRETGAVGGGLGVAKAIVVEVSVDLSHSDGLVVVNRINGSYIDGCLARYIAERIFAIAGRKGGRVYIDQRISVPIGGGYGSSGGSAVAIAFALAKALDIPIDFDDVAEIAHEADIVCKSGLGTVVGVLKPCDGIVLVSKPGGPRIAEVRCIPMEPNLTALTAFYRPIPKNSILSSSDHLEKVRAIGLETLKRIEASPTPENFIRSCYQFALETGFLTPKIRQVIELLQEIDGVIGASMNMVGEALFAIVYDYAVDKALEIIEKTSPVWVYRWRPGVNSVQVEELWRQL